jgi:hypothetical protein
MSKKSSGLDPDTRRQGGQSEPAEKKLAKSSEAKSQKQTAAANDVHYGYFSSVRTPAYRKGWGDIFSKRKSSSTRAKKSSAAAPSKKKATSKKPITLELNTDRPPRPPRASKSLVLLRWTRRVARPLAAPLHLIKMAMSALDAPTRHELEFNKVWIRENPDLAMEFARKFHADYNRRYKISINDEKYYITYVADLQKVQKAIKGK